MHHYKIISKINNIKTKKDLKSFISKNDINRPIFLGNYLFHHLLINGNLEALKWANHPIWNENDEGLNGIHLAAKITNEKLKNKEENPTRVFDFMLDNFIDYIYNLDHFSNNFLFYFDVNNRFFNYLFLLMKKYDLDWLMLLSSDNSDEIPYLFKIFENGSFKMIYYILKNILNVQKLKGTKTNLNNIDNEILDDKIYYNYSNIIYNSFMYGIFLKNYKISDDNIKKIYDLFDNDWLKETELFNHKNKTILLPLLKYRGKSILKYFVEKKFLNLDQILGTGFNSIHSLIMSLELDRSNNDKKFKISKYIWNKIKDTHNFEEVNYQGENLAHSFLSNIAEFENYKQSKVEEKLLIEILEYNTEWNKLNIDKYSILSLLIHFDFKKFHKVIENQSIDFNLKNADGNNIVKESLEYGEEGWYEFFLKLSKKSNTIDDDIDVKLQKYKYSNHTTFHTTFLPLCLHVIDIDEKYKRLYIPKNIKKADKINSNYNDMFLKDIEDTLLDYNNYAFFIIFKNRFNYLIHPMLNILMKNASKEGKYDLGFVFLSTDYRDFGGSLHANGLIYNFKTMEIEYFEPMGVSGNQDISLVLEEELCWNTEFKFVKPEDYSPAISFQYLSNDINVFEQKPGDIGGFCLAWVLWFLEHRTININTDLKKLVKKLQHKIMNSQFSLLEYIRNYSNHISKRKSKLLKKIGIEKKRLTIENFRTEEKENILNFIIKKLTI